MRDQVVTVFGGSGFIGRYLVKRLADAGAVIRVVTRSPETCGHLKPMGDVGQIVFFRKNIMDDVQLAEAIEGSDLVVNLIGILHERRKGDFERLQAVLPGRIAACCKAQGVRRFAHVSAIGADPQSPSLYASSKGKGEAAARAAFADTVILRPSIVIGPEDGFFNRFGSMSRILPFLPLIGGGKTRFQPVFVGDVAGAIFKALTKPDTAGKIFELGGPKTYTFKELLEYLRGLLNRRTLLLALPVGIARLQARIFELLPEPPLTRDQILLLEKDNVVGGDALTLKDLEIEPTPIEVVVPGYVKPYAIPRITLPVG